MIKNKELSVKQRKFADLYIANGNATQCYIDAGYKATTREVAAQNAKKLLRNYSVDNYIKARMKELQKPTIASQEEILEFLTKIVRGEEKDQFDLDASLNDRLKATELLGKKYGTWTEKKEVELKTEINVTLEDD